MPFGLTRKIWPFADSEPKMLEASLPTTRLSAIEEAPGWRKTTELPAPIEKLCQSMMARALDWSITWRPADGWEIVAEPEVTVPPVGRACCASAGSAMNAAATSSDSGRRLTTNFPLAPKSVPSPRNPRQSKRRAGTGKDYFSAKKDGRRGSRHIPKYG